MSPESTTPTIVLVHGAFAESAELGRRDRRAPRARATPPSPSPILCAAWRHDAAYLRSVIDGIDRPGRRRRPLLRRLGDERSPRTAPTASRRSSTSRASTSRSARAPASWPPSSRAASSAPCSTPSRSRSPTAGPAPTCTSSSDKFHGAFAADVAPEVADADGGHAAPDRRVRPRGQGHQGGVEDDPVLDARVHARTWPSRPQSMRFMAERAGSTTVEVDASHAVYRLPAAASSPTSSSTPPAPPPAPTWPRPPPDLPGRRSTPLMQTALTLIGLFVFGVSGALMAIRHEFDIVGIALLALITALGGGLVRDVVLGHTPPPALHALGVPRRAARGRGPRVRRPASNGSRAPCSCSTRPASGCSAWPAP